MMTNERKTYREERMRMRLRFQCSSTIESAPFSLLSTVVVVVNRLNT